MKVKALVRCIFEIEYEDDNYDIEYTKENIVMNDLDELTYLKTEDSIHYITIIEIDKIK